MEAGLLRQVAEPAADVRALRAEGRVAAEDPHRALVRAEHGGQHPQQRRLAGAVRAEQPDDALVEVEVDAGERGGAPVVLGGSAELHGRC